MVTTAAVEDGRREAWLVPGRYGVHLADVHEKGVFRPCERAAAVLTEGCEMITTRDTSNWKWKIEVAEEKAQEAMDAASDALEELSGLGEEIESEVDDLISKLETAESERDGFEKERDTLEDERNEARAALDSH